MSCHSQIRQKPIHGFVQRAQTPPSKLVSASPVPAHPLAPCRLVPDAPVSAPRDANEGDTGSIQDVGQSSQKSGQASRESGHE